MRVSLISSCAQNVESSIYVLKGAEEICLENLRLSIAKTFGITNTEVTERHLNLFMDLEVLPKAFKTNLKPLCPCMPRSVPIGSRNAIGKKLERMEAMGVIEKVKKLTEWCSGMVVALKSNGKVRICVDLTARQKSEKGILSATKTAGYFSLKD